MFVGPCPSSSLARSCAALFCCLAISAPPISCAAVCWPESPPHRPSGAAVEGLSSQFVHAQRCPGQKYGFPQTAEQGCPAEYNGGGELRSGSVKPIAKNSGKIAVPQPKPPKPQEATRGTQCTNTHAKGTSKKQLRKIAGNCKLAKKRGPHPPPHPCTMMDACIWCDAASLHPTAPWAVCRGVCHASALMILHNPQQSPTTSKAVSTSLVEGSNVRGP